MEKKLSKDNVRDLSDDIQKLTDLYVKKVALQREKEKVSTTVTVNEAITGLKSSFSFKIPDHKSGKLNLQYLNEKIALNCGIGMTTTSLIDCAVSLHPLF
ncbi:mitochondrial outer membrane protein porin 6-like [Carex rostrata]